MRTLSRTVKELREPLASDDDMLERKCQTSFRFVRSLAMLKLKGGREAEDREC
jgi:hypothetical protein